MSTKGKSRIPPHTHCRVCGRSIPLNKEHCSNECREKELDIQKRNKRMNRIFMVSLVIVIVLMVSTFLIR
ncbi:MAG: DUF2116 family Zn-ribbon domain-containing protein [Candidatus Methylarchaceae archaeon HK01B]|nr:DUF2116 family Zn-ribbon domain-containing protein [Candidatus Methylarchaceae archaeon HK01M]MCP8312232.1 DUF2116 family Zn-ribbon domain-containing protein [Candidatus Methylarchaceae archaeon HK02M1]MCP8318733.1 DUF2116 family Zn-ribbon domain-containing protein [Candidatus Methylarchaceae archaeon HK01B]